MTASARQRPHRRRGGGRDPRTGALVRRVGRRESGDKAPVTGRTPFPIGSVTKTFVAALAPKLADEGRLRLDDKLDRWLPDWPNADKISLGLGDRVSGRFG